MDRKTVERVRKGGGGAAKMGSAREQEGWAGGCCRVVVGVVG